MSSTESNQNFTSEALSMQIKIINQSKEMHILNQRVKELANKLKIIHQIDFIKYKLSKLNSDMAFKKIITNKEYKDQIEEIFKLPQEKCLNAYDNLLNKRNEIVHKYTKTSWLNKKKTYKSFIKNKTLNELAKCVY